MRSAPAPWSCWWASDLAFRLADRLGLYPTWDPRPGRADSERNCISNVRPPHGLGYAQAADTLVALLSAERELGSSGVALKDEGPALPPRPG